MTPARDPLIVAFTGRAGSGKSTAAQYLCERYGFVSLAFADPLKDMLATLLEHMGIDHAVLEERQLKERPIAALAGVTPRRLMQTLGTEWGRAVDPYLWVRVLEQRAGIAGGAPIHDRIVIPDCRFPNEAKWVRLQSGLLIRIAREGADDMPIQHASEAGVDDVTHILDNSGSLATLHAALDRLCESYGIDQREPVGV